MTGGQMAPTNAASPKNYDNPSGRDVRLTGHPLHVAELLADY